MTMPTEAAYRDLLLSLRGAAQGMDAAEDDKGRLMMAICALRAVTTYLFCDAEVRQDGLARPLGLLDAAALNAAQGAAPSLFNNPPGGAKPAGTMEEYVKGHLAWALELLTRSKMGTEQAARWIVGEARKVNLTDTNGSTPAAAQIIQWRKDIGRGRTSSATLEIWNQNRSYDADLLNMQMSDLKRKRATDSVHRLLQMLSSVAPRSAPKIR